MRTPGTRIEWVDLRGWLDGWHAIDRRASSATRYAQLAAHLAGLGESDVEAADLPELAELERVLVDGHNVLPPKGQRAGHPTTLLRDAIDRTRARRTKDATKLAARLQAGQPQRVAVIACGGAKRDVASKARDLYIGSLFVDARRDVENRVPWWIVSAAHALLEPDAVIEPYNLRVTEIPRGRDRNLWADRVTQQLAAAVSKRNGVDRTYDYRRLRLDGVLVELHAGEDYCKPLVPALTAAGAVVEVLPPGKLETGYRRAWYAARRRATPATLPPSEAPVQIPPSVHPMLALLGHCRDARAVGSVPTYPSAIRTQLGTAADSIPEAKRRGWLVEDGMHFASQTEPSLALTAAGEAHYGTLRDADRIADTILTTMKRQKVPGITSADIDAFMLGHRAEIIGAIVDAGLPALIAAKNAPPPMRPADAKPLDPADYEMCSTCGHIAALGERPAHGVMLNIRCPARQWIAIDPVRDQMQWGHFRSQAEARYARCEVCGVSVRVDRKGRLVSHRREVRPSDGPKRKPVECAGGGKPSGLPALGPLPSVKQTHPAYVAGQAAFTAGTPSNGYPGGFENLVSPELRWLDGWQDAERADLATMKARYGVVNDKINATKNSPPKLWAEYRELGAKIATREGRTWNVYRLSPGESEYRNLWPQLTRETAEARAEEARANRMGGQFAVVEDGAKPPQVNLLSTAVWSASLGGSGLHYLRTRHARGADYGQEIARIQPEHDEDDEDDGSDQRGAAYSWEVRKNGPVSASESQILAYGQANTVDEAKADVKQAARAEWGGSYTINSDGPGFTLVYEGEQYELGDVTAKEAYRRGHEVMDDDDVRRMSHEQRAMWWAKPGRPSRRWDQKWDR